MTETIDGDWRMLIEEEPLDAANRIYTLRDGLVLDADGIESGSFVAVDGGYRITIGESVCNVRSIAAGATAVLSGSIDQGEWSDPVTFSRVLFDVRPPPVDRNTTEE